MGEMLQPNNLPLNQACKAKLLQADPPVHAQENHLYVLQLALWGIDQRNLLPEGIVGYRVEQTIGDLLRQEPEVQSRKLDLPETEELAQEVAQSEPEHAAVVAIEYIARVMNLI